MKIRTRHLTAAGCLLIGYILSDAITMSDEREQQLSTNQSARKIGAFEHQI
jgi:hypothetical protein